MKEMKRRFHVNSACLPTFLESNAQDFRLQSNWISKDVRWWISESCWRYPIEDFKDAPTMSERCRKRTRISERCSDDFWMLPKMSKDFGTLRKLTQDFLKKMPSIIIFKCQFYNLIVCLLSKLSQIYTKSSYCSQTSCPDLWLRYEKKSSGTWNKAYATTAVPLLGAHSIVLYLYTKNPSAGV